MGVLGEHPLQLFSLDRQRRLGSATSYFFFFFLAAFFFVAIECLLKIFVSSGPTTLQGSLLKILRDAFSVVNGKMRNREYQKAERKV
jgi:hypothetical protein